VDASDAIATLEFVRMLCTQQRTLNLLVLLPCLTIP
jgi:hypothetical protein